ncbi:MAG: DUF5658 family protein [Planctomycetota bacterium]
MPSDNPAQPAPGADAFRERRGDRRRQSTPRFSRYTLHGGRRRGGQRDGENEGTFVDLYEGRLFLLVMWVAAMNLADCWFTLIHLQAGGFEVNPVADVLLQSGRVGFVVLKGVLIALALLILTLHKNFWLARIGLWVATGVYTLLVCYHLSLFLV